MSKRIIRFPSTIDRTGLSRSNIYRKLDDPDSDFPKPIKLGGDKCRAIGFIESEIDEWISQQIEQSRGGAA